MQGVFQIALPIPLGISSQSESDTSQFPTQTFAVRSVKFVIGKSQPIGDNNFLDLVIDHLVSDQIGFPVGIMFFEPFDPIHRELLYDIVPHFQRCSRNWGIPQSWEAHTSKPD